MIKGIGVLFFKRSDHLSEYIMCKEKNADLFLKRKLNYLFK